ncbi:xin actin-binding repeat-containing protein 2-like [Syngnathoides biaculeatus]|uniref:xin actin-binding repeat-containing protein 2-like n=1 Tax=Syngnathoides biaculeatus TaxID=300417 RepID=UPI002ADE4E9B|nr:xin actin-binding repeat-containing protein 2-like [Syngnathoides biaculeatus]
MEIQSGNGEGLASPVSSGMHSQGHHGPQVETSEDPVLKEDLQATKRIERFDIPLDSLKRMFEKSTEVTSVHGSPSKRGTSRSIVLPDHPGDKTMGLCLDDSFSAEEQLIQGSQALEADDRETSESVSLKERLALYQAAASHKESTGSSSAAVMDESEPCSLPGGLASVKKQFEKRGFASSSFQSSSSQFHLQQQSVQEITHSSEVTVRSSVREANPSTSIFHNQQEVIHDERVHHNNVATSHGINNETVLLAGGEELPKVSTQALKQQYEKNIEEAMPGNEIKVDMDFNQFQWMPVSHLSKTSTMTNHQSTSSVKNKKSSVTHETAECFPPPPPTNLLEIPQETHESSAQAQRQDPQCKSNVNKEQYFKNKSRAELKRLYKHIHPEVRKNLEEDYLNQLTESEQTQEMVGDVQQTCFMFENEGSSGSTSPDRESLEWDEILRGEVQSRRWMFENKPLDTIKDDTPDENEVKNIAEQEIIAGKDVKYTAWMFETQPMDVLGSETLTSSEQTQKVTDLARGDVRTATWLFETQPLDYLNKIYQEDEQDSVNTKDITGGDVKTARYLFETQHLDSLGKAETIEESHFLSLKSELEEVKGDVKTTTRMFETLPMCVIRGDSGEMLEITTIRREETEKGDVKTSRWMFETQPLDTISKDLANVKLLCGISMEDNIQGGVNKGRWLFETKTLDTIKDEEWETTMKKREEIIGADVKKHCLVFETQPMDTLKDNANARSLQCEEIVGGDVQSAKHLFETVPMENLKDLIDVGKLQKMAATEEEKGDVRHQKWVFESQPLANIGEEKKEVMRTVYIEALDKGDVTNCKEKFESMDLSKCEATQKIQVEGVTSGSVESNRVLFESTPLYAMQDSSGHYHEVRTVRREEIVKGDVHSCRWMFETRPIDDFDESLKKFQIIKGISKQEIESGDVKTAKWLFETQQLDAIKHIDNEEKETKDETEIERGDVKTCRWLFETQPMDVLYDKTDKSEVNVHEVQKGDVKTCTWLFETQSLDNIRDHTESESETILKTCTVKQEEIQGKDVRLARFLFETENLENLTGEDSGSFKRVTEIDIQSGDVSRMKYIFENRSSDIMSSTSEETMQLLKMQQAEDIQRGNVVNCTWMFENHPIDTIHDESKGDREIRTVTDVQGGDVGKGRFTFETFSLDQIKDESTESDISKLTNIFRNDLEKGDVKNYTMMFETQPLYAICDKEGYYHEVTTVTKEEIVRGDVVGARWLFETKPLDSIRDSEEVYVIKAVTEEGINKGDVSSARWRFETQPLDEIAEEIKVKSKTVADIQGGDVRTNKQRFETDEISQKYIRTVSVSEIQKGDVKSATWMFETHAIDEIGGERAEYDGMEKVTKEEVMKGDVQQSVWLFEEHPLDSIKKMEDTEILIQREEILQGDVKTTTWLFETKPFNEFNERTVEKRDIVGKSIKETLEELYCQKMVNSQGILIEADEIGDVRMAKYKLMNQETPQIQREEIILGDLSNIMLNLLNRRETTERAITIDVEERGNINTTVEQLFNQERSNNIEKEEILHGDIQEAMKNLLSNESSSKRGILIQEDEKGDVRMTIYSLLNKGERACMEKEDIIQGNVSKTLHRLLSNSGAEESKKIRVGDIERGNVSFYTTCIESGALDYLKQLQYGTDETAQAVQKECIIGGDIEETKILLRKNQQEIGRTVAKDDIVPGNVCSIVQVFMTEPTVTYRNLEKQDIVKGDLSAALDSLSQAVNHKATIEKEEVVKGDIPTTLKSLEKAQHQPKEMEKPEIIRGDIRSALESLEKSATTKMEGTIEDLVPGDIKGTLKSLEEAKHAVKEVEKEEIVKGDIHIAMQSLHEASSEKKTHQHQVSEQGDVKTTIQLLLEPTTSPRMQRRGSIEGDVKTSINSLYEGQETTFVEKEEVVKGDVQGAIKCLMQKKQYSKPKRMQSKAKAPQKNPVTVNQVAQEQLLEVKQKSARGSLDTAVKKLFHSCESQKHNESKLVKTQVITNEASMTLSKTDNTAGAFQQKSIKEEKLKVLPPQKTQSPKTIMIKTKPTSNYEQPKAKTADMKTIKSVHSSIETNISNKQISETKTIQKEQTTVMQESVSRKQNATINEHRAKKEIENKAFAQRFKNMKSDSRNLDMVTRGVNKKGKPELYFPPPPSSPPPSSESELSLPPPPSPLLEIPASCLSQPPTATQESDLPPPPPPVESGKLEPEFFPPHSPTSCSGQDFLPPPPSQEELSAMPLPPATSPGKPIGKPFFKVPKQLEEQRPAPVKPKWQSNVQNQVQRPTQAHLDQEKSTFAAYRDVNVQEDITKAIQQSHKIIQSETKIPNVLSDKHIQKASPQPPKKIFPPIKLPLPPEPAPAPQLRPYARKFKTPLMLAEEKYRQQKMENGETGTSIVTTSTSPPVIKQPPLYLDSLQLSTLNGTEKVESTKASKISVQVPKEETSVQHITNKKMPSQIPLSKPVISVARKKVAPGCSNLDSKQPSSKISSGKLLSSQVTVTNPPAPVLKTQPFTVSQSEHYTSNVEVQSCSNVITSKVTQQQQIIKDSKASNIVVTHSDLSKKNIHVPGRTAPMQGAEDVKNVNELLTKEGKMAPSQPTKNPKVTPCFKVRTFKMPAEKKNEEEDALGQEKAKKSEKYSQQQASNVTQRSEAKLTQESRQVTSSMTKVQVEDTKNRVPIKKESLTISGEPVHMNETKKTQPPAVTVLMPKKATTVSVPQVQQSVKTQEVQRQEEMVVTERVVQHSSQRQEVAHMHQKQKKQEAAEIMKTQTILGKSNSDMSVAMTCMDEGHSEEMPELEKFYAMQTLLTQMKELEGTPSKIDSATVSRIISDLPDWLVGSDERKNLCGLAKQSNKKKLKEMVVYLNNIIEVKHTNLAEKLTAVEMKEKVLHSPPPPVAPKPDQKVLSGVTTKLSKISIGSSKTEKKGSEEKKSLHESKVQYDLSEAAHQRVHSPLASIRTPSPTFISIESRKIESPLSCTPSPPPYKSVGTPPPPTRKQYTATSTFRATPSPTMNRSEKMMKLKDTTSKVPCNSTPPPPAPPPPPLATAGLFVEAREGSTPCIQQATPTVRNEELLVNVAELSDSMMTVRDKKCFFEEAQKAEVNKSYLRKDPIDIPERLEADTEESGQVLTADILKEDLPRVHMTKLVNKFESSQATVYSRKEPIVITERLGSDPEDAVADPHPLRTEEMSTFNVKAIKNVFESGEHSSQAARDLREQIEKRESDFTHSREVNQSEMSSLAEGLGSIDEFGNIMRSEVHSGTSGTRGNPPSYADVVRGRVPTVAVPSDASTEELLRNLQQSWAESQGNFQNVGFRVMEQRSSQIVTHQQETVVMEDSSSRFRTVQGLSEEGVPDGISDCRQAKLP